MNRREAIANLAMTSVAASYATGAAGQSFSVGSGVALGEPAIPIEERKKQYAICKERGHTGSIEGPYFTNAVMRTPGYVEFSTCKYCGSLFRFVTVTTLEESNVPK